VQILEKVGGNVALDKGSGKKASAIHGKSKLAETEKDETGEEKIQEHIHCFL
jgi:hypothetical protein